MGWKTIQIRDEKMNVDIKTVKKIIIKGKEKTTIEIPYLLWIAIDENSDLCKKVRNETGGLKYVKL